MTAPEVPVLDERDLRANRKALGIDLPPGIALVTSTSPRSLRLAVEMLAGCFRDELGYAGLGYAADDDDDGEVWLFTGTDRGRTLAVGYVAFRRHQFPERAAPEWLATTAWMHPGWRRQGQMADVWPSWRDRYPESFWLALPISANTRAILTGRDDFRLPNGEPFTWLDTPAARGHLPAAPDVSPIEALADIALAGDGIAKGRGWVVLGEEARLRAIADGSLPAGRALRLEDRKGRCAYAFAIAEVQK